MSLIEAMRRKAHEYLELVVDRKAVTSFFQELRVGGKDVGGWKALVVEFGDRFSGQIFDGFSPATAYFQRGGVDGSTLCRQFGFERLVGMRAVLYHEDSGV